MIRRLEQFIKNQGLSVRSFEQSIGASDGMIRRAIKNNTDIQSKWLSITADIYPNLDINWLLTGRGFMLKSESTSPTGEHVSDPLPLPTEESLLYTMYKEEKAENKELIEQIGALKQQIKTIGGKDSGVTTIPSSKCCLRWINPDPQKRCCGLGRCPVCGTIIIYGNN